VPGKEDPQLDLALAALFAGQALNDEVLARVRARGYDGLRHAHGYVVQRLIEGPRPVGALAAELGITQQAVSKSVGELERLGLVERRPDAADARVRNVALTDRGRGAIEATRAARSEVVDELRDALGPRRVDAATRLLRDVLEARGLAPAVRGRRVRPPRG
jgi:DNA-binding MarR family transcriptional regulator